MQGKLLFVGTGAFALGVLFQTVYGIPWQWIALCAICGILCTSLWFFGWETIIALICVSLLGFSLGAFRTSLAPTSLPKVFQPFLNHQVSFTGIIIADPDRREYNQQLVLRVDYRNVQTSVLIFAPLTHSYEYGEAIAAKGVLESPTPFATDNGRIFRYDHYLAKKGIFADIEKASVISVRSPQGPVAFFMDTLFFIKHTFVAGLSRALPHPFDNLATGLLTGDQHSLGDDILTMLALSGLVWVVVLSGYHVTLIAEGVLFAFSFLPKRFALSIAGLVVGALVVATGASAPSIRGSVMAGFALFARGTNRRYDSMRALAVTLILVLLWNPLLLAYDQGFELSVIVTPALVLAVPIIEMRLLWIRSKFIREVLVVSMVAQISITPLLVWQTGQVSPWAIPANTFVMPIVPLVMLCSVVAGFAGIIAAPAAPFISLPAHTLLFYILFVANISTKLPFANATLPPFSFLFVILVYALLIICMWLLSRSSRLTLPSRMRNVATEDHQ